MSRLVRSPEIVELKAFCAAADFGSLGRAARLLGLSQPALSKRLRTLEGLVGVQLLERSHEGVRLTSGGRRVYEEARKILERAEALEEVAGGLRGADRPVRLAVSPTISEAVLPPVLAGYEPPPGKHLSLELTVANSVAVRRFVIAGQTELGIAASMPEAGDELEEIPFLEDEVVLAVPSVHNWSGYEEVPLRSFLATSLVMRDPEANSRRVVERVLAEAGHEMAPPLIEVGSTNAAKEAARTRSAPALLSALVVKGERHGLELRRVAGLRFKRRFAILCAAREALPPDAQRFLHHLEEHSRAR